MTELNHAYRRRFVRITFQECEEPGGLYSPSDYETRGILQDIRLISGWFRIADDQAPEGIAFEIVAGELVRRATSTLPGIAHSHFEVVPSITDMLAFGQVNEAFGDADADNEV